MGRVYGTDYRTGLDIRGRFALWTAVKIAYACLSIRCGSSYDQECPRAATRSEHRARILLEIDLLLCREADGHLDVNLREEVLSDASLRVRHALTDADIVMILGTRGRLVDCLARGDGDCRRVVGSFSTLRHTFPVA